ncbi:MAG: hypothetical protein HZC54_11900 [Verrucomicrobia bacterium]|nr:hypothetical protein [Verrucomicrobiota bacterium]
MKKFALMVALLGGAAVATALDISVQQESDRAVARGLEFLGQQQQPDGSWRKHPGITGPGCHVLLHPAQRHSVCWLTPVSVHHARLISP